MTNKKEELLNNIEKNNKQVNDIDNEYVETYALFNKVWGAKSVKKLIMFKISIGLLCSTIGIILGNTIISAKAISIAVSLVLVGAIQIIVSTIVGGICLINNRKYSKYDPNKLMDEIKEQHRIKAKLLADNLKYKIELEKINSEMQIPYEYKNKKYIINNITTINNSKGKRKILEMKK